MNADGDYKLVVADLDKKLKIFKGTSIVSLIATKKKSEQEKDNKHKKRKKMELNNHFERRKMLEHALLEQPVALNCYYMDTISPLTPVIAVAAGAHIFIYKHLKPFFKFTLPNPHVELQEQEIWNDYRMDKIDYGKMRESLKLLKDKGLPLTTRSQDLLVIHEPTLVSLSFFPVHIYIFFFSRLFFSLLFLFFLFAYPHFVFSSFNL